MILPSAKFSYIRPPEIRSVGSPYLMLTILLLTLTLVGGITWNPMHRATRYVRDASSYQKRFADPAGPQEKPKSVPLSSRIVRTKYGDISGVIVTHESRHVEPVEVFRGVPYAMPPTGNLRFMPPVTSALWSGVKVADKFSPVCPQRLPDISNETLALKRMSKGRLEYLKRLLPYLQVESEDCLYLNIYVPAQAGSRESSGSSRYPVIVFVHGESYEWNSGNAYDGSVLASYGGVLVVTINFRLGILGFLNANSDPYLRSPTNYGLMDQIAALHWIQENIAVFGGDPTNVTILGHGTGAACVHLLMSSSAVPDGLLFHRAILMSGSALSPWAIVQNPLQQAQLVARHANCSPDLPHPHLLKCLRDRPLEVLMSTQLESPQFVPIFGPSIDGVVIDSEEPADLDPNHNLRYSDPNNYHDMSSHGKPQHPPVETIPGGINTINSVLLRKNVVSRLSRYDLLLGVVRSESYFAFNGEDVQYGIEGDRRSKILRTFVKENYRYHLSEILATIVNEYTDWERPVQHPINIRDETLEALSDAMFVAPIVHTADLHSASRRNSFLYVFEYQTKYGDFPQRQGCIHGEELPYVFGAPLVGGLTHFSKNFTKAEILISEATMIYWSNFARTGNPNEPQESDLTHSARQERSRFKNIEWTAYEAIHKKYLNFDTKPKVKNHYRAHRLSFWLNLVPDLHRPGGDDVPRTHHQLIDDVPGSAISLPDPGRPRGSILQKKTDSGTVIELAGKEGTVTRKVAVVVEGNSSDNSLYTLRGLQPQDAIITDNAAASASASAAPPTEDGFAAYSTALSVTIAIGCSLLIINVLIFAGVYYQRDKNRLSRHRHHDNGSGSTDGSDREQGKQKKLLENGIPNSICGEILRNSEMKTDPGGNYGHIHHHMHHQLPPPEFADLPPTSAKHKAIPCVVPKMDHHFGTLPRPSVQSHRFAGGTLPRHQPPPSEQPHNLNLMNPSIGKQGTATNKQEVDELRV